MPGPSTTGLCGSPRLPGVPTEDLAILAGTDPIPHDAITVRIGLDGALADRSRPLWWIGQSEAGRRVIAENKKGLTGFVIATERPIRRGPPHRPWRSPLGIAFSVSCQAGGPV